MGTSLARSPTADPLRSLETIDLLLAVRISGLIDINTYHASHQIPVVWDTVDIKIVGQRAHEEWARRQQIREQKQLEARKGDKLKREAIKARRRAESGIESSAPPQKRQRVSWALGKKAKRKRGESQSSESEYRISS